MLELKTANQSETETTSIQNLTKVANNFVLRLHRVCKLQEHHMGKCFSARNFPSVIYETFIKLLSIKKLCKF
jgi:hypothetical protein